MLILVEGAKLQSALQYIPGAQYRITAWALGDGRRSATPAVVDATTRETGQCILCLILKTFIYT